MSTFADAAIRAAVRRRAELLTPQATRLWGRMSAHQMVCHLTDSFRMATGTRASSSADNFFSRSFIRWVALHTSFPWPKGTPTMPEADQERGGTKPVHWDRDLAALVQAIDTFTPVEGFRHPLFGPLKFDEWHIWGYRHADHHLRQFSA